MTLTLVLTFAFGVYIGIVSMFIKVLYNIEKENPSKGHNSNLLNAVMLMTGLFWPFFLLPTNTNQKQDRRSAD